MTTSIKSVLEILETLVISLAIVLVVRTFIAQPFLVSGSSMEPNFKHGDYLLIDELSYRFRDPERGEVIVFKYPRNHRSHYIKRIVGLPGETILISSGKVIIQKGEEDAKRIKEEYATPSSTFGNTEVELGPDEYFVMGDNRNFSFDSRNWGPLKRSRVTGIVRLRLWPVNEVLAFSTPTY